MPYVSDAQRRWAHTDSGKDALGEEGVKEWDEASKGLDLPERADTAKARAETIEQRDKRLIAEKCRAAVQQFEMATCGDVSGHDFHGNQWTPGLSGNKAAELRHKVLTDGGFTYDVAKKIYPTSGFAVSMHQECERVLTGKTTSADFKKYASDNAKILTTPGAKFGAWIDVEANKLYLDVTHVEKDITVATKLAKEHNQEGIYDLEGHKTIIVKEASERRLEKARQIGHGLFTIGPGDNDARGNGQGGESDS